MPAKAKRNLELVAAVAPATPGIDEVVKLLRSSDLGAANRQIAADYPQTTLSDRSILLREATRRAQATSTFSR